MMTFAGLDGRPPQLIIRDLPCDGAIRRIFEPQCLRRSCDSATVWPCGLHQHVQGGPQVSMGVDDVGARAGVIAWLLSAFRHRGQRLPGRNERGLQADADVTVARAQTRSPNRGPPGGYRTRPPASERGTARAGSRFP